MRKVRHEEVKFYIGKPAGHFSDVGWANKQSIRFRKKNAAEARANQLLSEQGQVYIKVVIGKFYNDAICNSHAEIRQAFEQFTSDQIIRYALEGK